MTIFLQRGQAAVQSKNFAEALGWFKKATEENPKDAQAKACLGQTLCWLGKRKEGIAHLRLAGQLLTKKGRKTRDISLVLGLAEQLQFWNDYPGALELARQAVQIHAAEPRAFQVLALSYSRLNQGRSALAAGRQAARLAPDSAILQIQLATLEIAEKQHNEAKGRLEKVLQRTLTTEERFRAHKELARALDKLGEPDQVFAHLHASAEVSGSLPEVQKQDANLVPSLIQVYREGFDRELLTRWSGAEFPVDLPAPVFLIGFLRSGTTLTQAVLGAHPDVFIADETDLIAAMREELQKIPGVRGSIPERLRDIELPQILQLRQIYWNRVRAIHGSNVARRLFVDKTTMNTIDLGLIHCVFPDAKIAFVLRDPRDVCLSCFMQTMIPSPSTVHLLRWRDTAEFYALVMDWWLHIKERMTLQWIEFRYEDAVAQFEPTFRRVFDFLGLSWDPAVAEFHRRVVGKYINSPSYGQVAQPLYKSSVARWKHYESEFASIADLLRPYVTAFGYQP